MVRRRINVPNIPEPIRQALLADFARKNKSMNDIVQGILVDRYKVDTKYGGGHARGSYCDPLILKMPVPLYHEIKLHAARSDTSMRALIIDALARHYNLSEHSIPLARDRSYYP